jgi:phosphocarrier protein
MKTFDYVIKDAVGIHARPAGFLVKAAKEFKSEITLKKGDKSANMTQLFGLMKLGVKCNDTVTVTASGEDEDQAIASIKTIMEQNL